MLGFISVLLLSYSISSGSLRSPDLLLSYSTISLVLHDAIILIITLKFFIFQPYPKSTLNQHRYSVFYPAYVSASSQSPLNRSTMDGSATSYPAIEGFTYLPTQWGAATTYSGEVRDWCISNRTIALRYMVKTYMCHHGVVHYKA